MKSSKFTEAQKAFILKQGEQGTPIAEICRKAGISQATCFNGNKRYPKTIRVDNGMTFISRDLDLWGYVNNVTLDFSHPGKPKDNGFIEAFNSKLRAE